MDTSSLATVLPILGVLLLGALVRGSLGFGDALVAMPLLVLLVDLQIATPLVQLHAITIAAIILAQSWREVDLRVSWRLALSGILGVPIGLLLLKQAPEAVTTIILGVVLVGFGLYNLTSPSLPYLKDPRWAFLFGFAGGVLGGAYNTNGPPGVIYGVLRRWPPERFRAMMQGYLLPVGLTILVGHGVTGLWTQQVIRLYLMSVPLVVFAVIIGRRLNRRLSSGQFNRVIYAFLVVMGILLVARSL